MTPPAAIGRASSWLALSLLLVMIATLALAPPSGSLDSESLLFLGVAALLLENAAVFMPCFGVFSPAPAVYLAAGATPGLGPAAGMLLALGGLLLRTVLVAPRRDCKWFEAWLEIMPVALGLAAMAALGRAGLDGPWPSAVAAGAIMALARQYWPRRLMAERLERNQYLTWVGVLLTLKSLWLGPIFGGLTILALMQTSKWQMLWALPLLWGVCKAADYAIFRVEALEAEASRKKLAESQSHLEEARTEASRARVQLQSAAEREALLEGFAQQLASDPTIEQVVKGALATIRALVPCDQSAIYLAQDGQLEPSGRAEPGVRQAFASGRVATPRTLAEPKSGGDAHWLAVPLGREGVLYVGRDKKPFNKEEGARLALVAEKATLAIGASRRSQARQQAFQESTAARYQLQERVGLLALLMEGARELASSLEIPVLEKAVKELLERVVPHDVGALITSRGQFAWAEGAHRKPGPELAHAVLVRKVLKSGQPHLDADGATLIEGMKSLIVVPLRTEQEVTGALLLAAGPARSFNQEHENLLSAIAYQAAVALANAGHFQDVVEARRQLEQSQAQLIQTSKLTAVGQLAAGVSHELNNPLGAISVSIASAQTQLSKGNPDKANQRLERALKATERAQHIINKLLFYSRKSADEEPVDLVEVVTDTIDFLHHHVDQHGFTITTDLAPVPTVMARPKDLQQVLVNLVLNAIDAGKALPAESRQVIVATSHDQQNAQISVRDRGPGMPPEVLERIFEPFYTTKDVGEGTGLGLSVSHQIVTRHGGTLTAESEPGKGAVFYLRLPLPGQDTQA